MPLSQVIVTLRSRKFGMSGTILSSNVELAASPKLRLTLSITYVHCEAGRGRTGVAIACYRMAVSGWGVEDALTEAVNFGCIVPGQQAFIREFGQSLRGASLTGRYPLLPVGSVSATPAQLSASLRTATDSPEPDAGAKQLTDFAQIRTPLL